MTYVVCQTGRCQQTYSIENFEKDSKNVPCEKCGGVLIDSEGNSNFSMNSSVIPVVSPLEIVENNTLVLEGKRKSLNLLKEEIRELEEEKSQLDFEVLGERRVESDKPIEYMTDLLHDISFAIEEEDSLANHSVSDLVNIRNVIKTLVQQQETIHMYKDITDMNMIEKLSEILIENGKYKLFLKDFLLNTDHDPDAHKYNTVCLVCEANKLKMEVLNNV